MYYGFKGEPRLCEDIGARIGVKAHRAGSIERGAVIRLRRVCASILPPDCDNMPAAKRPQSYGGNTEPDGARLQNGGSPADFVRQLTAARQLVARNLEPRGDQFMATATKVTAAQLERAMAQADSDMAEMGLVRAPSCQNGPPAELDPRLAMVIEAWDRLPEPMRHYVASKAMGLLYRSAPGERIEVAWIAGHWSTSKPRTKCGWGFFFMHVTIFRTPRPRWTFGKRPTMPQDASAASTVNLPSQSGELRRPGLATRHRSPSPRLARAAPGPRCDTERRRP